MVATGLWLAKLLAIMLMVWGADALLSHLTKGPR